MEIVKEINQFSSKEDKPILLWLFERYHWDWQWRFVAKCEHVRRGDMSYETDRVWEPTVEGVMLYWANHLDD